MAVNGYLSSIWKNTTYVAYETNYNYRHRYYFYYRVRTGIYFSLSL